MPDPVFRQSLRQRNKDFSGVLRIWLGLGLGFFVILGESKTSELFGDTLNGRLGRKGFGAGGGAPDCEFGRFRILGGKGFREGKEGREGLVC